MNYMRGKTFWVGIFPSGSSRKNKINLLGAVMLQILVNKRACVKGRQKGRETCCRRGEELEEEEEPAEDATQQNGEGRRGRRRF
jgi:hypothetical protein